MFHDYLRFADKNDMTIAYIALFRGNLLGFIKQNEMRKFRLFFWKGVMIKYNDGSAVMGLGHMASPKKEKHEGSPCNFHCLEAL